jgi:hypothetical protein
VLQPFIGTDFLPYKEEDKPKEKKKEEKPRKEKKKEEEKKEEGKKDEAVAEAKDVAEVKVEVPQQESAKAE